MNDTLIKLENAFMHDRRRGWLLQVNQFEAARLLAEAAREIRRLTGEAENAEAPAARKPAAPGSPGAPATSGGQECNMRDTMHPSCPRCDAPVAPGNVITANRATWREDQQCYIVGRKFICEPCGIVVHWLEQATSKGAPLGLIISGPGISKAKRGFAEVCKAHPERTGVIAK